MAVKSYQAQGEGEISLSKGEKIKGKGARVWARVSRGTHPLLREGPATNSCPEPGASRAA